MWISIKQRYKPFTHTPGAKLLLPGTNETFQLYPSTFSSTPIDGFTILLDLERGQIVLFGKQFKKIIPNTKKVNLERLSFGVHKKQEWEWIARRCNVEEFLPLWYHLSQWYESTTEVPPNSLLAACFEEKDKLELTKKLQQLFRSGFSNLFFPEATDPLHHGYTKEPLGKGCDPTLLLSAGRKLIRSFFFRRENDHLSLLPLVPKGIHCGRFLHIQEEGMRLDFEWTKHLPRRLVLELEEERTLIFQYPSDIKEFRIKNLKKRIENGSSFHFPPGRHLFDQFKK